MTDSVADAARSAAAVLAPDLGLNLPVEVEAALAARSGDQRPDRYLDLGSLGSLIVSAATLAWTSYNDQRNRSHEWEPEADSVARQVRITLREQDTDLPPGTERVTEVVATEIIRHSTQSKGSPARVAEATSQQLSRRGTTSLGGSSLPGSLCPPGFLSAPGPAS